MSFPHPPARPTGSDSEARFMQLVWDMLWDPKTSIFCDTPGLHFDKTPRGYVPKFKPSAARAISGWHFESKIEADNTKNYPAQTVIHIQPTDALVTTGIRDAANPSGPLVKSCAGYWVSTQAVAAKKTVGGNDVWNLPQYPYPNAANMDDPANFWIYLGEMDCGA